MDWFHTLPYWLQCIAWLLAWCGLGLLLRPLIHRTGGRND